MLLWTRLGALFLLFLFSHWGVECNDEHLTRVEVELEGHLSLMNNFTRNHYVQIDHVQKKYLFFTLNLHEQTDAKKLSIGFRNGTSLRQCSGEQAEACYLSVGKIQINDELEIRVECEWECSYEVRSYYSGVEQIELNKIVRFTFNKKEIRQMYHLDLKSYAFVRVVVKAETRRRPFDRVSIYGSYGDDSMPSFENYDLRSVRLWEDAEGLFVNNKSTSFNFILYGNVETIYTMTCIGASAFSTELLPGHPLNDYLEPGGIEVYHITFIDKPQIEHVIKLALFSGNVSAEYFEDEQLNFPLPDMFPFQYMGDAEIFFTSEQLTRSELYVKVSAHARPSSFMVNYHTREVNKSIELVEHVTQFLEMKGLRALHFTLSKHKKDEEVGSALFIIHVLQGEITINFENCTKTCTGFLVPPPPYHSAGLKRIYEVGSDSSQWVECNQAEDCAQISVLLFSTQKAVLSTQFISLSRTIYLRENRPIQSFLRSEDIRVFKYQAMKGLKLVRVAVTELSGTVQIYTFRADMDQTNDLQQNYLRHGPILQFADDLLTKPIVIVLRGIEEAVVSVLLLPIDDENVNSITLAEDQPFRLRLASKKFEVVEVYPFSQTSYLQYEGSSVASLCELNESDVCQTQTAQQKKNGQLVLKRNNLTSKRIKVFNPSEDSSLQITLIFYSHDMQRCKAVRFGTVGLLTFNQSFCLTMIIPQIKNISLYVKEELLALNVSLYLCEYKIQLQDSAEISRYISAGQIQAHCHPNNTKELKVVSDLNRTAKVHFLAQYTDGRVTLTDGVAHTDKRTAKHGALKEYLYDVVTIDDVNILVIGGQKMHFDVIIFPTGTSSPENYANKKGVFHSEMGYYGDVTLKITKDKLVEANCVLCSLLIKLFTRLQNEPVQYKIEVTQNYVRLVDGVPHSYFLDKGSLAYFNYQAQGGTLYLEVADNNQHCSTIYVSRREYPDQFNFFQKSFTGEIVIENANGSFYFSVEASSSCTFTISLIGHSKRNLVRIEKNSMGLIRLEKGDKKYFFFKHDEEDEEIKIISLGSQGSVKMRLSKVNHQKINLFLTADTYSPTSYDYVSPYQNRLSTFIKNDDQQFLLQIQAISHVQATIFLAEADTPIPLVVNKVFSDILLKADEYSTLLYFQFQNMQLEINVYKGSLLIIYQSQNGTLFTQKSTTQILHRQASTQKMFLPSQFKVQAKQNNTIYTLKLSPQIKEGKLIRNDLVLTPGFPSFLYLLSQTNNCYVGTLNDLSQELIISVSLLNKKLLKQLTIVVELNKEPAKIKTEVVRNTLALKIVNASKAGPYRICLNHPSQQMSMTLLQSKSVSLLPASTQTQVVEDQMFTIYPQNDFLLDVFECRGAATVRYGDSPNRLQNKQKLSLAAMGMPGQTHAIKISRYSLTFLQIIVPLALVRWFPMNVDQQLGIGYLLFETGKLWYNSNFKAIDFYVQPLQPTTEYNSTIKSIVYTLYLASDIQSLKEAAHCQRYLLDDVFVKVLQNATHLQGDFLSHTISKIQLLEKYQKIENIYLTIVADLNMLNSQNVTEDYRFIYPFQQIPAEVFIPNRLQRLDVLLLIFLLLALIGLVLVFAYFLVAVILPFIGRLRTSNTLGEEMSVNERKQEIPMSSDRATVYKSDDVINAPY